MSYIYIYLYIYIFIYIYDISSLRVNRVPTVVSASRLRVNITTGGTYSYQCCTIG